MVNNIGLSVAYLIRLRYVCVMKLRKKYKKKKCTIPFLCRCVECGEVFDTKRRKLYCGRSCRDKAEYDRNGRKRYKDKAEAKKSADAV